MTEVSATDANRHFSKLLRDVENGATVTITKDGQPVAVIMPAAEIERRAAAQERLWALMRKGSGISVDYKGPLRDLIYRT